MAKMAMLSDAVDRMINRPKDYARIADNLSYNLARGDYMDCLDGMQAAAQMIYSEAYEMPDGDEISCPQMYAAHIFLSHLQRKLPHDLRHANAAQGILPPR